MAEFRLVTDDASSSLWELVDKELAVKRQTKTKYNYSSRACLVEAFDECQTNIMDIVVDGKAKSK